METRIEEIRQVALRSRVIMVGSIVTCALMCIAAILFHTPKVILDKDQMQVFESKRDAIEKQNDALQQLVNEQNVSTRFFASRDSSIQAELVLNRKAIEKIKITHENYSRFDSYTANDWTAYFSALPDPGQ